MSEIINPEVKREVELALIHRDISDLKVDLHETTTSVNQLQTSIHGLATSEDIQKIEAQLAMLMPWAQTLQSLERFSKWIAAITAMLAAFLASFSWIKDWIIK